MKIRRVYVYALIVSLSAFGPFLSQNPAMGSAEIDYACLPIPQKVPCLPPTVWDMAGVSNFIAEPTEPTPELPYGLDISSNVTTFYEMNASAIYIVQITNDKGQTIHLTWEIFSANKAMQTTSFFERVSLEPDAYTVKVMIWTEIDRKYYPLILRPETKNPIIGTLV